MHFKDKTLPGIIKNFCGYDKERKISLHRRHHKLGDVHEQIEILEHSQRNYDQRNHATMY